MTLFDLLFLVIVGVFIFSRFFSHKLPKDLKKKGKKHHARVLDFPKTPDQAAKPKPKPAAKKVDWSHLSGLDQVKAADPKFNDKEFLKGAQGAYEFYYDVWNKKDDEALANLCSPKLMDSLVEKLDALDAKDQSPQVEIKRIVSTKIADARMSGRTAIIDVTFVAEQSENTVSSTGKIVGKQKPAKEVTTIWTLARPIDADDPNWVLESIAKPS